MPKLNISKKDYKTTNVNSPGWRYVPGFNGRYIVSKTGLVAKILKPRLKRSKFNTHASVCLFVDGKILYRYIHRLVLEAFVGPCHLDMEACHENDDGLDNRLKNLRWDTRSSNRLDKARNRARLFGAKSPYVLRRNRDRRKAGWFSHESRQKRSVATRLMWEKARSKGLNKLQKQS